MTEKCKTCNDSGRVPCEHYTAGERYCYRERNPPGQIGGCPAAADTSCTIPCPDCAERVDCEHYENVGPGCDHDGTKPCPPGADENCTVLSAPEDIDHDYTREVVCPWCGHEHSDSWEWWIDSRSECTEFECERCEKPIEATRYVEITYSTRRGSDD